MLAHPEPMEESHLENEHLIMGRYRTQESSGDPKTAPTGPPTELKGAGHEAGGGFKSGGCKILLAVPKQRQRRPLNSRGGGILCGGEGKNLKS